MFTWTGSTLGTETKVFVQTGKKVPRKIMNTYRKYGVPANKNAATGTQANGDMNLKDSIRNLLL
jgi:hypothetical protein